MATAFDASAFCRLYDRDIADFLGDAGVQHAIAVYCLAAGVELVDVVSVLRSEDGRGSVVHLHQVLAFTLLAWCSAEGQRAVERLAVSLGALPAGHAVDGGEGGAADGL